MPTMFDKLGDLLSEALEKGELPKSEKSAESEKIESTFSDFAFIKKEEKPQKYIIPQDVKNSLNKMQIPEDSDYIEAKRIYRERLMHYHPDRRNDNPVLQKVAKEKTAEILREWEIVEKWFKTRNQNS